MSSNDGDEGGQLERIGISSDDLYEWMDVGR